jgi:hypothetical protein
MPCSLPRWTGCLSVSSLSARPSPVYWRVVAWGLLDTDRFAGDRGLGGFGPHRRGGDQSGQNVVQQEIGAQCGPLTPPLGGDSGRRRRKAIASADAKDHRPPVRYRCHPAGALANAELNGFSYVQFDLVWMPKGRLRSIDRAPAAGFFRGRINAAEDHGRYQSTGLDACAGCRQRSRSRETCE